MNNNSKKAVMRAAVVAGVILGASTTGAVANASDTATVTQPAPSAGGATAAFVPPIFLPPIPPCPPCAGGGETPPPVGGPVVTAPNTAPVSIARISIASGAQAGGQWITVTGKNLAVVGGQAPTVTFTLPAATKRGEPTAAPAPQVQVLTAEVIRVLTPAVPVTGRAAVTVTNGSIASSSAKAPTYTFTAAAPAATVVPAEGLTSETGGTITIIGGNLGDAKTTKVQVGGKAATVASIEPGFMGMVLTVRLPAGVAAGSQDVVVTTAGGSVDAGVVQVTATTASFTVTTSEVSVERGGTLPVAGEHLDAVTGGTLTDAGGRAVKVTVRQAKGQSPFQVVIPARLAAGTWNLVLNTKYTSSAPQTITVTKAGKPAIAKTDVSVGRSGGFVTLGGSNLRFIQSVKVGGKTLQAVANPEGTALSFSLPAQTKTSVPVVVTTDGGTVSYQLKVSPSTLTSASYDAQTLTITVTGMHLSDLMDFTVTDPAGKSVESVLTVSQDGTSASFTFAQAPAAGDYNVTVKEAAGTTLGTKPVTVPGAVVAKGTLSGAFYTPAIKQITLSGTDLALLQGIVVTDGGGQTVDAKFSAIDGGTTALATLVDALVAGEYTVNAKDSTGTALTQVKFNVAAPATANGTLSGANYDATAKTITLSGTDLGSLQAIKVTDEHGTVVPATFTANSAGTKSVVTLDANLATGSYTVTAKDSTGGLLNEVSFVVSAPVAATGTLSGAWYDATAKTITLSGTDLGALQAIKVTDEHGTVVPATFTANSAGTKSVVTFDANLAAGSYTVTAKDSTGGLLNEVSFVVS